MLQATSRIDLRKGKEKPILQRHHWIYSGAIANIDRNGEIAVVHSSNGEKLGLALLNTPGQSIFAHMIAFGTETLAYAIKHRIQSAFHMREKWFDSSITNAYRLINAEGDGIPGLIIDSYAGILVFQISHPGTEKIKDLLISLCIEICKPRAIIEKSTSKLRKKEGMQESRGHLYGEETFQTEILENGIKYSIDFQEGQKTGFFLDQREARSHIRELSKNRRVLNCFAYTGGFSLSALQGGATHVTSVEISKKCHLQLEKNIALNHLPLNRHEFICSDVFEYLKTCDWNYDLVILDPPAFAKKKNDIPQAFKAYKEMNQYAISKMASNSLLLTCSCSYHIDEALFRNLLFRASLDADRHVCIVSSHRMAIDHPISIFHPESAYLKSFLLSIH
ncbi:MAG TPA: class I SAM-dependent rRNA methyltransferase [Chlamydiales bacterium]|nr:class I SAM-dependent rRNA methyltransferase [Chlamydiales bacterium]